MGLSESDICVTSQGVGLHQLNGPQERFGLQAVAYCGYIAPSKSNQYYKERNCRPRDSSIGRSQQPNSSGPKSHTAHPSHRRTAIRRTLHPPKIPHPLASVLPPKTTLSRSSTGQTLASSPRHIRKPPRPRHAGAQPNRRHARLALWI